MAHPGCKRINFSVVSDVARCYANYSRFVLGLSSPTLSPCALCTSRSAMTRTHRERKSTNLTHPTFGSFRRIEHDDDSFVQRSNLNCLPESQIISRRNGDFISDSTSGRSRKSPVGGGVRQRTKPNLVG